MTTGTDLPLIASLNKSPKSSNVPQILIETTDGMSSAGRRILSSLSSSRRSAPAPVTFVHVQVRHDPTDLPAPLELVLAHGRCLRIPPGFDPAHLRALLLALEDSPC